MTATVRTPGNNNYIHYLSVNNLLHCGSFERHHRRVEHVFTLMASVHR